MVVVAIGSPQPAAVIGALPEGTNSVDLTLAKVKLVTSAWPVTMNDGQARGRFARSGWSSSARP